MKVKTVVCSILTLLLCVASPLYAMDIGLMAPTDEKFRTEVYYENYKRDVKKDHGSDYGAFVGQQEEERVMARFSFNPKRFWGFSLEAGGTDAEGSEDVAPIFGAGVHMVLLEKGGFYTSVFGKITWVTGIEYKNRSEFTNGSDYIIFDDKWDEDYIEYAMGVQVGHRWEPCTWATVTSYAGAMATFIDDTKSEYRSNVKMFSAEEDQIESWSTRESGLDMEEDHVFQAFAGISTTIKPYDIGVRVEGRFYDRTSLSASLFWNF